MRKLLVILFIGTLLGLAILPSCNPQSMCSQACQDIISAARNAVPVDGGTGGQFLDIGEQALLQMCQTDPLKACDAWVKEKIDGIGALNFLKMRAAKYVKLHDQLDTMMKKLLPLSPPTKPVLAPLPLKPQEAAPLKLPTPGGAGKWMPRFRVQFAADFEARDRSHALRVVAGFFAAQVAGLPPGEEFDGALRLELAPEEFQDERLDLPLGLAGLAAREQRR